MYRVTHTFLFREGLWVVSGEHIDRDRKTVQIEGTTRITHSKSLWRSDGFTRLLTEGGAMEIKTEYEIVPFRSGAPSTTWTAFNPALGHLSGRFVVVDDSIISTLASSDGQVTGVECLLKVSDMNYRSRGFVFKGGELMSSWAAELLRADQALH